MPPMKVLISGGGITGNALAFWLAKLGHEVTVLERFSTLRTTGLQIDLRGHGIEVLKRMGLEQAFRAKCVPEQGMRIVDGSGRQWAYFPANNSGKGRQSLTSEYEIMRGDLCRLLYDATPKQNTKYIFGASVESFTQDDRAVKIRFTNGKTDQYDLWVGADGQGSRTRKMMLGVTGESPGEDGFHPLKGNYIAYYTMPSPMKKGEGYLCTAYIATGGRGMMLRRHNAEDIQVYLSCTTESKALNAHKGNVEMEKAAFTEIFKDAGYRTEELLEAMNENAKNDFYCERLGVVKLDSWYHGRVALVGDAAYAPSANTGMGTTSGIVGAYILAGEIGRHCGTANTQPAAGSTWDGLQTALKAYDDKFHPFMSQVQKGVVESNGFSPPSSAVGIAIMNVMMWVASLLKIDLISKFVIREEVRNWDLPDYEELKA